MKVTPVGKNFNKHKVGETFTIPDKLAHALIKLGMLVEVTDAESADVEISPRTGRPKRQYQRRDMQAQA